MRNLTELRNQDVMTLEEYQWSHRISNVHARTSWTLRPGLRVTEVITKEFFSVLFIEMPAYGKEWWERYLGMPDLTVLQVQQGGNLNGEFDGMKKRNRMVIFDLIHRTNSRHMRDYKSECFKQIKYP